MTAAMLVVLLALGSWQVKRLFWKEAILARIDQAEAAAPVPLPETTSPEALSPFMKVSATGTFMYDEAALYGADVRTLASGPEMGARMIVPMRETNGDVILVDRGWVPLSRSVPIDQPGGTLTVSGYVRPGDSRHWFSVSDDPVARRFFTLDPRSIGNAVGQPNARPFILVVLDDNAADEKPSRWPDPARHLPRPPNNHLSYAITWYGLAVALLVVFVVWAKRGSNL
jgi:surfeit locus 1 family protein